MRIHRIVPVALAAVFAASCIEDPTLVEEEGAPPLSQEEIDFLGLTALQQALQAQEHVEDSTEVAVGADQVVGSGGARGPALAPVTLDLEASTVIECELGGDVEVDATLTGEYDDETGAGDIVLTVVKTHDLCRRSLQDFEATIIGDPSITTVLELFSEGDGIVDIEGSIQGGFGVLTGGRLAECLMDLAFSGVETADGQVSLDLSGEVCGRSITTALEHDRS